MRGFLSNISQDLFLRLKRMDPWPLIYLLLFFFLMYLTLSPFTGEQTINLELINEWHNKAPNEDYLWMGQNGTFPIIASKHLKLKLSLVLGSFYVPRDVFLFIDEELIDAFQVSNRTTMEYSTIIDADALKVVKLYTEPSCYRPFEVTDSNDTRCISLQLWENTVTEFNQSWSYGRHWYPKAENEEGRWMWQNSTIYLFPKNKNFQVGFEGWGFLTDNTVDIYIDDVKIDEVIFLGSRTTYLTPLIEPKEKIIMTLYSQQDCITPVDLEEGWDDVRCMSVQFTNISLIYPQI